MLILDTYLRFPDRKDRLLNIGDCTPISGPCTDIKGKLTHPGGSHAGMDSVDLDYFTFNTNVTQYRSGLRDIDTSYLWKVGNEYNKGPSAVLDTKTFDWMRNFYLWRHIYKTFPECHAYIDARIGDYMKSRIIDIFGYSEYIEFSKYISAGEIDRYHHDTHIHFTLYAKEPIVNWDHHMNNDLVWKK